MPKYYFDLVDGSRLVDPTGLECRDDHDANAKAKIIAKQIEVDIPTAPVQRHVEVLNEDRDKVAKVPSEPTQTVRQIRLASRQAGRAPKRPAIRV
jgi:hypothetical protein